MSDPRDPRTGSARTPGLPPPPRPLPPHLDPRRGTGPGRPPAGSRRVLPAAPQRGRGARVLSWIAVVTSFAVLAVAVGGYLMVNHYNRQIDRIDDVFAFEDRPEASPSRDARNILLVGSDSRGELEEGEGTQGSGESFVTGQRSDTVILAHLYGDSDKVQLISFPRDAWVTIPAHEDPETGELVKEQEGKLNAAFFQGGPPLLIQTLEELTDLRIDNYVQIDFDGFRSLVDTLGGVEVCLSEPAQDELSGIDLPAGRQTLEGEQALAFVRQRQGLAHGDLDRIGRQQQFLGAIVRKTLSAGTLLNPFRLNDVIGAATESLQVDESLSIDDLRDLAMRFRGVDAGDVVFTTVPVADIAAWRDRQSVVLLDEAEMDVLFDRLRRDVPPGTPDDDDDAAEAAPAEPLTVPPSDVRVRVFNGAGVQGLGRRAYDDLAAVGFQLVGVPDNRGSSATGTTVLHGPDRADSARTLAAAIPGARPELDPSLTRTLEVVVGSSYAGAEQVSLDGEAVSPTPSPTPSPTASPLPRTTAAEDTCAA